MPRVKTICDICCNEVIETESNTEDALFCEGACQKWVHRSCAGVTRFHFEKLSKSDDPWYCPCCTVVSQNKQIDTLKCKIESLTAELAKTYEYFADKTVQLQNELKQQKDCCRSLEDKLESVTVQQITTTSSRNKGNSNHRDRRKQRKKSNRNHSSPRATFGATENGTTRAQPGCNMTNSISGTTSSQLHHDVVAPSQPREKVSGVRRIWGTLSNCTTTVVRNVINRLTDVGEQIEVKRKYKSDRNRKRWWFLLKGSEEVLESLESNWEPVQIQTNWKLEQCTKPVEVPDNPTSPFLDQAQ